VAIPLLPKDPEASGLLSALSPRAPILFPAGTTPWNRQGNWCWTGSPNFLPFHGRGLPVRAIDLMTVGRIVYDLPIHILPKAVS
jgi:hypothetical protein